MNWMDLKGFVGPSNALSAKSIDSQRTVNMYAEMIESGSGKDGQQAYLKSCPGLVELFTISAIYDYPIRLIHPCANGGFFVVSETELYLCTESGGVWSKNLVNGITGVFTTNTGPVRAATSLVGDEEIVVFVDGRDCYLYLYDAGTDTTFWALFASFGYVGVGNASHVKYIDGYFVFNQGGTNQFYVSDYASFNVDPLSFASAEGDPDNIEAIEVINRNLIILNTTSTEIWYNSGNADFPFERISGGFFEIGILAKYSIAKDTENGYFLSKTKSGDSEVIMLSGLNYRRISTHALETKIKTYANPQNATGYVYKSKGHTFYVLTFDEATWAYDVSTGMWAERAALVNGEYTRERIDCYGYIESMRLQVAGDRSNSKVYVLSDDAYSLNGDVLCRERTSPTISAGGALMLNNALMIECEVGVGLNGTVQGSDPMIMLTWSDDGGKTWSNGRTKSLGKIGEARKRIIFERLGSCRQRIYKIRITDPVPVDLLAAKVSFDVGAA